MKISASVILIHLLLIAALIYFHLPQLKPVCTKALQVQTFFIEQTKAPIAVSQNSNPLPPPPKKTPIVEKEEKSPPTPKKQSAELTQMLQQCIENLDKPSSQTPCIQPKQIGALASESQSFETSYEQKLIAYLQSALTLPEKGEIKLSLTVTRNGSVEQIAIKQSTSEQNCSYVETRLPLLFLPPFENYFRKEKNHTFSITLTSS